MRNLKCNLIVCDRGHTSFVTGALYTKDAASNVITASADGTVRLWDARTAECLLVAR